MKAGIVGLPNVGKSTLFNCLSNAKAQSANFPFCTIEPNIGVVNVPDTRLQTLEELVKPERVLPATVEIVDIAGLVKGASKGEGLGNQFLANIRETDAILHVFRCFDNDNIVHVDGSVNPIRDKETIDIELQLKDLETVEKINSDLDELKAYPSSFLMQQQAPDREWAWQDWHMKKTVANIYGIGGIGKSTFLLSLANHISLGREFCSSKTVPMKTLCIFCEEDINEIARRQQQVQMGFGYMMDNDNLLIAPRVGFDNIMVYYDQSGLPQKGKFFHQLYEFISEHKIEYLILDTLSDIFGGSEIIRSHVNYFMKAILGQLINELGVTILISGHPSISGQSGHKFSGSTAWQGATRSLWYMDKSEDGSRELCRLKSNYSNSGKDVKLVLDYQDGVFKQRVGFVKG